MRVNLSISTISCGWNLSTTKVWFWKVEFISNNINYIARRINWNLLYERIYNRIKEYSIRHGSSPYTRTSLHADSCVLSENEGYYSLQWSLSDSNCWVAWWNGCCFLGVTILFSSSILLSMVLVCFSLLVI